MKEILVYLIAPITIAFVKWMMDRKDKKDQQKHKETSEAQKILSDSIGLISTTQKDIMESQRDLQKSLDKMDSRIDDVEQHKASLIDFQKNKENDDVRFKDLWKDFRVEQKTIAEKLGYLEGKIDKHKE